MPRSGSQQDCDPDLVEFLIVELVILCGLSSSTNGKEMKQTREMRLICWSTAYSKTVVASKAAKEIGLDSRKRRHPVQRNEA